MKTIEDLLEVYVSPDGDVCIAQQDMAEDCYVAIKPEDVDRLVEWLQEKQLEAYAFRREPVIG